ncbi:MAG TPA: NAD(P)/FAD-dependent oxidoreductase, partial [Ktedonobacteraceae bacterium]
ETKTMNEKLSHPLHSPSNADIIIVGGGLSGLAAATYAAKSGRPVTLFEKASEPGGRAITKQRNGFSLNLGAHALYDQTEAGEILRELGVPYSGKEPPLLFALAHDKLHILPQSSLALLRTTLLDASAKLELVRVQVAVMRVHKLTLEHVSLSEWLDQHVRHPQLRALLLMLARVTTYTNAPEMLSAALFVEMLRKVPHVLYLDGGWQTLVNGLRQAAQNAGVRIVTGARVVAIEHEERVQGVRLAKGEFYPAEAVIVATDPAAASALVDNGEHAVLRRWTQEAVPSFVACLDVALRRLPEPQHLGALSTERPLYMVVHSASARLAPERGALIHTIRYLEPGESPDLKAVEQELEALLDRLQPGWQRELVERQFLPHMNATNAIVQARLGSQRGRPGPEVPGIRNLYVVGDWVGPAGQLTAAGLASARQAAHLACEQTLPQSGAAEAAYNLVVE